MALRYQPTTHGEHYDGWPRATLTDEWLTDRAAELGCALKDVVAAAKALRRVDGRPLYAPEESVAPPPARPPSVPLGDKPKGH